MARASGKSTVHPIQHVEKCLQYPQPAGGTRLGKEHWCYKHHQHQHERKRHCSCPRYKAPSLNADLVAWLTLDNLSILSVAYYLQEMVHGQSSAS